MSNTKYTRETIKIPSVEEGIELDVWFYRPSVSAAPYPVIIAGHGATLIKEAGLDAFGRRWAEDAQYASLIFDYRGFGPSGGKVRELLDITQQRQDYESVLKWARARPDLFRANKIVLGAISLSGIPVGELAMRDAALAGAIAQCPVLDRLGLALDTPINSRIAFWAVVDGLRWLCGFSRIWVPAIGKPGSYAWETVPSAFDGFTKLYDQNGLDFSKTRNAVCPGTIFALASRKAYPLKTAKCPVLVVAGKTDDIVKLHRLESIAKAAEGRVELYVTPGGHFDLLMPGNESFDLNIEAQIAFLRKLL
ncbi:alpha/beta-hydrolase [Hysterangium stoloniferum]|nr:alpha/beta-hydrolase [Hysterangium stoloniferum]